MVTKEMHGLYILDASKPANVKNPYNTCSLQSLNMDIMKANAHSKQTANRELNILFEDLFVKNKRIYRACFELCRNHINFLVQNIELFLFLVGIRIN